jgi:hypothetical protein
VKKIFEDDSSYIEVVKSKNPEMLLLSLCARDSVKQDQITMISVEIRKEELEVMIQKASNEDE